MRILLASTSPYRIELLRRLDIPFSSKAPAYNEEIDKNASRDPVELSQLLATKKAESLINEGLCVIGADQVVHFNGKIFGKAHRFEAALQQLNEMVGHWHEIVTSVHVKTEKKSWTFSDVTRMKMRPLHKEQLASYLQSEKPYDCAGSYKIESQGIRLFEAIETKDFTAIQGLPLIQLTSVLMEAGVWR